MPESPSWAVWALLSGGFAALTAILGERPTARDWLGIGCVTVGVALLGLRR